MNIREILINSAIAIAAFAAGFGVSQLFNTDSNVNAILHERERNRKEINAHINNIRYNLEQNAIKAIQASVEQITEKLHDQGAVNLTNITIVITNSFLYGNTLHR